LFNGLYINYPVHFKITDIQGDSIVLINAGEGLTFNVGTEVKLYNAYFDTTQTPLVAKGLYY
jgi:hypothetical protein